MSKEKILNKQNEERLLKIQYVSRKYYNEAELTNCVGWILCAISALFALIPNSEPVKFWLLAFPVFLEVAALVSNIVMNNKVEKAGSFRGYFDAYVLSIELNSFEKGETASINERAESVYNKHICESKIQISHNGHDIPPGVKDWYEFNEKISDKDAVFECQHQNAWWNNKLSRKRIFFMSMLMVVVAAVYIVLAFIIKMNIGIMLLCTFGLILKFLERLIENVKYFWISKKIDDYVSAMNESRTEKQIEQLQKLINKRRAMPILEINAVHKKVARQLSELYQKI